MQNKTIFKLARLPYILAISALSWAFLYNNEVYCGVSDIQQDHLIYGLLVGFSAALASFSLRIKNAKFNYFLMLMIRGLTLYFIATFIYYFYFYESVFDINTLAYEDVVFNEIPSAQLHQLIQGKLPGITSLIGVLAFIGGLLLITRKTTSLGMIATSSAFGLSILANANLGCSLYFNKVIVGASCMALLPAIVKALQELKDQQIKFSTHPIFNHQHGYASLTLFKYLLVAGGLVFMAQNDKHQFYNYYATNLQSPIKGVWYIKDVEYDKTSEKDYQTDSLFSATKIYLSSSRYGKIMVNDTLTTFEYMVDPSNNQFELWNFYDYRKMDLKGKFEYVAKDTIEFNGKNEKDFVRFKMVLEPDRTVE